MIPVNCLPPVLTASDFFNAFNDAGVTRVRMVEYQGEGVLFVQVPPRQLERAKAAVRDRTSIGLLILFDALPWFSCLFTHYRLVSVLMGQGRP